MKHILLDSTTIRCTEAFQYVGVCNSHSLTVCTSYSWQTHNYQTPNALLVEPSNQRAPLFVARQKMKKVIYLLFEEQWLQAAGDVSDSVQTDCHSP